MRKFLEDTLKYLREYFKRVNSENGFAQDKRLFGDKVRQKREDRIDTVLLIIPLQLILSQTSKKAKVFKMK